MADSYIDNNSGSKKKYLIPLVVLMICAVSLTGAGYAYSANNASDLTVSDNTMDAESMSLDFAADASAYYIFQTSDNEVVDFYDHLEYAAGAFSKNVVSWAPADSKAAASNVTVSTAKLKITYTNNVNDEDEAAPEMKALTLSVKISTTSSVTTLGNDKVTDITDVIDYFVIHVTDGTTEKLSGNLTLADTTATAIDISAFDFSKDITVTVLAHVLTDKDDASQADAAQYVEDFEALKYKVEFTASE